MSTPRGPLTAVERHAYAEMQRTGHRSASAIGFMFALDDALRAALAERDLLAQGSAMQSGWDTLTKERDALRAKLDGLIKSIERIAKDMHLAGEFEFEDELLAALNPYTEEK